MMNEQYKQLFSGFILIAFGVLKSILDKAVGGVSIFLLLLGGLLLVKCIRDMVRGDFDHRFNITEKTFDEIYNDDGIFTYEDDSFHIKAKQINYSIKWVEVETILAYMKDLLGYDTICMEVYCKGDKNFTIYEETEGWHQFVKRSKEILPGINAHWDADITTAISPSKYTLVYDREKRSLGEVMLLETDKQT